MLRCSGFFGEPLMWGNPNDFAGFVFVALEEDTEWRVQTLNENFTETQAESSPTAELSVTPRTPDLSSKSRSGWRVC